MVQISVVDAFLELPIWFSIHCEEIFPKFEEKSHENIRWSIQQSESNDILFSIFGLKVSEKHPLILKFKKKKKKKN